MRISAVVLCTSVLCVFVLSGCSTSFTRSPRSWSNVPLYPGAQNVSTEEQPRNQSKIGVTTRITRFTTSDGPEAVISFYEDLLSREGWTFDFPLTPEPNTIYAGMHSAEYTKDSVYGLRIIAKESSTGQTEVEVHISEHLPR
jgi:hypothetical protein